MGALTSKSKQKAANNEIWHQEETLASQIRFALNNFVDILWCFQ